MITCTDNTLMVISPMLILKIDEASRFLLHYHFLYGKKNLSSSRGIETYMTRVRAVQFDPIDMAGTNPDLVFQSRLTDYKPDQLRNLLYKERRYLDHFDKEMCIYHVEDWPKLAPRRESYLQYSTTGEREKPLFDYHKKVLAHLKKAGPSSSSDINLGQSLNWYWGSATSLSRAVLEHMYYCGRILVHHKQNKRKYYDQLKNILPAEIMKQKPFSDAAKYEDWYMQRRIASLGLIWNRSGSAWLGTFDSKKRALILARLVKKKKITEVRIEGLKETFYINTSNLAVLEESRQLDARGEHCRFLAPLDNFLWDRKLIKALFGFDYVWEIYKPENKRQYGYYVLPVLCGAEFAARFEPVADRKEKILHVKNWWWEDRFPAEKRKLEYFENELNHFMNYLGCETVVFSGAAKKALALL